jgi:predicted SnoaL-like aldol condensation-catalyzing enzyme
MKKIQTLFLGLMITGFALGQSATTKTKTTMLANKQKIEALYASFETGDPTAAQLYLKPDYIQHNLNIGNGLAGFGEVMKNRPPQGFKAKIVRILEDGDFVITHSDYDFFGPKVGFGIFRFENGQVTEHWDNLEPIQPKNPSGRTQLDGEIIVTDKNKTAANKAIIKNFADDILIGGKMEKIANYQSPDFHQHNPNIADGQKGLGEAFAYFQQQGLMLQITKIHKILGEGNFVLVVSEGKFGKGEPAAFYDLFRLDNGKIVEHWDIIEPIPQKESWRNQNGKF